MIIFFFFFSGLDVPVSRRPPGQGPRLPVSPLLPGQVQAPVHAAVAPGPRHGPGGRGQGSRGQYIGLSHPCHVSQTESAGLAHVFSECHRVVIIKIENCDVSNQKIKCLTPCSLGRLTTLL